MKRSKTKNILIIALCVVLAAALIAVACLNITFVHAATRSVTISGSSIFYTSGDADVWSHKEGDSDSDKENDFYTMFVLTGEDGSVKYRRNLAYEWHYNFTGDTIGTDAGDDEDADEAAEEDADAGDVDTTMTDKTGLFSMEIGFEPDDDGVFAFEKIVVSFDSQQYQQTEDEVTTNYVIFAPAVDGSSKVRVLITDDPDAIVPEDGTLLNSDHITIAFTTGNVDGKFAVSVSDEDGNEVDGTFSNIYGTFSKYVSSSTDPVNPIGISAINPEEGDMDARVILYDLNEQSFALNGTPSYSSNHYLSGSVNDDAPAVLCVNNLTYLHVGEEIEFEYSVIDVLASSPSIKTSYFMLTDSQAESDDIPGLVGDYEAKYKGRDLYKAVSSDDKQYLIPHTDTFVPVEGENYEEGRFVEDELDLYAAVKVVVRLTDTTASGGFTTYVLLDWFADDNFLITVNDVKYIAVAEDVLGPTYAYSYKDEDGNGVNAVDDEESEAYEKWQETLDEYQELVDEAAADLIAGSKNKFYLPDATDLFSDNCTSYENMTFSIYYYNGSTESSTGLASNELSITLSKSGKYVFTIVAEDKDGNAMWYYNPDYDAERDKDSKKRTEISGDDIWSMYSEEEDTDWEDTKKYLPWFTFEVTGGELSIETTSTTNLGYVDSTFSDISFDINAVEYTETYKLYLFDADYFVERYKERTEVEGWTDEVLAEAGYEAGEYLTYDLFTGNSDFILANFRDCFTEIKSTNDMNDNDKEYETFRDYAWNNSSKSFVPQETGFYLVTCTIESTAITGSSGVTPNIPSVTAYLAISVSEQPSTIKGESTWARDNVASIVLLSVAGAALIGIILLIFIRPREKQDLDEIALAESGKKAKKSKKSDGDNGDIGKE